MSNAATPLGLAAMGELSKLNRRSGAASDEMCMFVVVNSACLQLIPSTLIGLRQAAGSHDPGEIIFPIWIASFCALASGVLMVKLMQRRRKFR